MAFLGRLAEYGRRYNVKFDVSKEKVIAIVGKRGIRISGRDEKSCTTTTSGL